MTSWDYSSPRQSYITNESPPSGKGENQEATSMRVYNVASDEQPKPPGEEDADVPSLQCARPPQYFNRPKPSFPTNKWSNDYINRSSR